MATDTEQLILSISADTAQIRRALKRLEGDSKQTTQQVANDWSKVDQAISRSTAAAARGGQNMVRSVREVRAATTNLSYQLNDISSQLLSGTSPFTIMVQQGTQVTQALQSIGGAGGGLAAVGRSFASMLSPMSLLVNGLILATGYAVSYFGEVISGGAEAEDATKKHAEAIANLKAAWEEADKGLGGYIDSVRKMLAGEDVQQSIEEMKASLVEARDAISSDILSVGQSEFGGATAAMEALLAVLAELDQEADKIDFRKVFAELNRINRMDAPQAIKDLTASLRDQAKAAVELQTGIAKAQQALDETVPAFERAKNAAAAFIKAMTGLDLSEDINALANTVETKLVPAFQTAISTLGELGQKTMEAGRALQNFQNQMNTQPLGTIPPVYSGGGQFLNPDQLNTFRANAAESARILGTASAALIKAEEGFINAAKWDVNHFRVGFGSDTYVDEMGRVQTVTKDTVITLDQANADLARRIGEFQSTIMRQIGPDMWASLAENQKAALTSIAYNYGQLPKSIVAAIQSGGGSDVVAKAISELTSNPERRKREAEMYGGSMYSAGSSRRERTPDQIFSQDMEKTQANIRMLQAQYDAMQKLGPVVEDYGYQVAYATEKQRLLNEAQAAGVTVTPELEAQIDGLAKGYATAAANVDQLKTSQANAAQAAQQFGSMAKDFLSGFISDLRNGKSATEALANALSRLADQLLDMALNMLFSNLFGGGGIGIAGFEKGGIVGRDRRDVKRRNPNLWKGAPRFAVGGMVGLKPGEVPIVAHRGELIVPRSTLMKAARGQSAVAGGGNTTLNGGVNIDMSSTGMVAANAEDARKFGLRVQKAVQMIMVQESRPGGLLRRAT